MSIEYKETLDVDLQEIDALWSAIGWRMRGSEKWREVLSKSSYFVSAWKEGKLVGTGRIVEDGVMCMFYDIGVHPQSQREGIGSGIMERLIAQVKDKAYVSIGLFAWEKNPANIPFYRNFGFEPSARMELRKFMRPE